MCENDKLRISIEISALAECSIHHQEIFLNAEYTFEHFHFLKRVDSTKIEKNIDPSDLPPKTPQNGGGSDTLNGLDFGYVSR